MSESPFLTAVKGKSAQRSALETKQAESVFAPSVLEASPVYAPAVVRPVRALPPMTPQEIEEVGADAGISLRRLNGQVLQHQRANQGDEMTGRLNLLIKQAKKLDPDSIKQSKGIAKFIKRLLGFKEDVFAEFDSVNGRIDQLVDTLKIDLRKEEDAVRFLDQLHEAIGKYAASLDRDLELLTDAYQRETEYRNTLAEDNTEERQASQDTLDLLEIRIGDIRALRLLCTQMGPRVKNMQKTSAALIRSARNIVNNVIPAYSMIFSTHIESLRQKDSAAVQNGIIDSFQEAIVKGGELAAENQIAATQLANRQVIDIETLRQDQQNLIRMIEETNRINTEARTARIEYIQEIQKLEDGVVDAVKSGLI